MENEKSLLGNVEDSFNDNKGSIAGTMKKMDSVLTAAASSVLCYILLFVLLVLGILLKMTK
eukprot:CAMPEP_0170491060 /NCGR_PEP_ID=MMETSP0208-20121228/10307_1 /TAXON_ID=197538 /ORGANISM="Strombidium inclinatum, Strain S3" /LENGTH=60 /DNA_ID=CAMNT_0010766565 /DNA_START=189 /DNA_END=371 /DNA_ORIENTATION=+